MSSLEGLRKTATIAETLSKCLTSCQTTTEVPPVAVSLVWAKEWKMSTLKTISGKPKEAQTASWRIFTGSSAIQ